MGIIRLEDKYKSKYKVQLTPERHYVSSSSGITGSVHVFPNRSETQKDNIDERLNLAPMALEGSEFSGAVVRAFDSNSLEARREEIYRGSFGKFIGGAFTDALIYEYTIATQGGADVNSLAGQYTGEFINDEIRNDPNWDLYNATTWGGHYPDDTGPVTATRLNDGKVFTYQSNDVWVDSSYVIHNTLPESDRDTNGQNFEIALGMLLDGANPFTVDHAWRVGAANAGNSSYTGTSQPETYRYTGFKVFEDELGIPYLDSPVLRKEDINAWPPEVAKWDANVISNWVVKGYSDLSMHPRNATKKEVILKKADHNMFSSGSLFQRTLANRIDDIETHEGGWWVHNDHSLCLSKYTDGVTTYEPALGYWNQNDRYTIDWSTDEVTFEFWIKPCTEQTEVGTIVALRNNFAITLIPDVTSISDGVYQTFKIGIHSQENVVDGSAPTIGDIHLGGASNPINVVNNLGVPNGGVYVTGSVLKLGQWHHVAIRYSANFNNGLLNVYVDSVSITGGNVDGLYDASGSRTAGLFDIGNSATAGSALLVGGWPSTISEDAAWGEYSDTQEVRPQSGGTNVFADDAQGFDVAPQDILKSELKELRVWSETKTEAELLANKFVSLTNVSQLRAYIRFLFDPRDDTPQWKRLRHRPFRFNPKTPDEFYGEGTSEALTSAHVSFNPVQYCTNNAHIVGMPFVNVHSHLREYVNGSYPVIYRHRDYSNPSGAPYPTTEDSSYANSGLSYFSDHWQSFKWLRAINSMILPSDCEKFDSKYDLVGTGANNYLEKDYLSLQGAGVGSTSNFAEIATFFDDEVFAIQDTLVKIDPKLNTFRGTVPQFGTQALVSENKLGDKDFLSPLSTTIAIPQIYYGNRIHPDSIELKFVLNEEGKEITVVDFEGTLYRKDLTIDNIASKVGHVDYGNGLICIFSPLLTSLGIDNFDLKFKGEKNMHVMQLDIPCSSGVANKSQHPSYKKLKPSANANETDSNLTYISTIYLHDENLNIIGKVNLAQPVQKREEDSFIFRVKVDF